MNRPNQNYNNSNYNSNYNNANNNNNNAKKFNFKQANSPVHSASSHSNHMARSNNNNSGNHYMESANNQNFKNMNGNAGNLNETTDDDFLDISDNELIRASQVVESQLKFTNNVHHTTSNAINIFSQFSSNNFNEPAPMASQIMGPPSSTAITMGGSSKYSSGYGNDPSPEAVVELKKIKAENMAKDGEVKILREKLKKLEQENQRIRAERIEMVKKLNEQKEEDKRTLQKQIEFKELENQFKSQEIVELTMKYKVLESSVKKNPPGAVITSTPSVHSMAQNGSSAAHPSMAIPSQMTSQFPPTMPVSTASSMLPPPNVNSSKTHSMKRVAHESLSLSDNENENPVQHESKRPNLDSNGLIQTVANGYHQQQQQQQPKSFDQQSKQAPVMRLALSPYSNNQGHSNIIPPYDVNKMNQAQLANVNNYVKNQQQQPQINQINPKLIKNQQQLLGPSVNPPNGSMAPPATSSAASRDFLRNKSTSSSNLSSASRASSFCLYKRKHQLNIRFRSEKFSGLGSVSLGQPIILQKMHQTPIHSAASAGSSATTPVQAVTASLIISPSIPSDMNQINSKYQQQQIELKNRLQHQSNERVYSIIESFVEMINYLNGFNSLTKQTLGTPLNTNSSSTHAQIQSLNGQLSRLLNFIKKISSWYSSPSHCPISLGNLSSSASSLSASERIEFVSNRLNEELVKLIKYCLNTSLLDGYTTTSTSAPSKPAAKANVVKQSPHKNAQSAAKPLHQVHKKVTSSASNLPTQKISNQSAADPSGSKTAGISSNSAATSISIVDLLCLAFDICHHLFLNRVTLLIVETETAKDQLIQFLKCQNSNSMASASGSAQQTKAYDSYVKLMKLKREFFKIVSYLLKSINFTSASMVGPSGHLPASLTSLSSSSSSYSTLKILNSIIDCFNHLYYLPISHHKLQPYSFKTFFYFSLVDNMHNIFKKMKIFYPCSSQSSRKKKESESADGDAGVGGYGAMNGAKSDQEMDENEDEHEDFDEFNYDSDDVDAEESIDDFSDLNEPCLYKLFFSKTTKYFSEIVYTIESTENNSSLKQEENSTDSTAANSEDYGIITSIAVDNSEHQSDYDEMMSMVQASEHKNNHSLIMSQEIFELQSQIPNDDDRKTAKTEASSAATVDASAAKRVKPASVIRDELRYRDASASSIQLLQTQFLNHFIYFLHNYQLISSLEYSLIMFNNRMRRRRLHNNAPGGGANVGSSYSMAGMNNQHKRINLIKQFVCHNQKCMCFKEMMVGFLSLIDYQFNEKFIFGAELSFDECFYLPVVSSNFSPLSSNMTMRPSIKSCSDEDQLKETSYHQTNSSALSAARKTIKGAVESSEHDEKPTFSMINRIHYVLLLRCCNIISSLLNSKEIRMNLNDSYATKHHKNLIEYQKSSELRLKFFNALRDDYRLRNFVCLFKLADIHFEALSLILAARSRTSKSKKQPEANNSVVDNYTHTSETILLHHLDNSLKLLRGHLKNNFFPDYFQSASSDFNK